MTVHQNGGRLRGLFFLLRSRCLRGIAFDYAQVGLNRRIRQAASLLPVAGLDKVEGRGHANVVDNYEGLRHTDRNHVRTPPMATEERKPAWRRACLAYRAWRQAGAKKALQYQ